MVINIYTVVKVTFRIFLSIGGETRFIFARVIACLIARALILYQIKAAAEVRVLVRGIPCAFRRIIDA